MSIFLIFHKHLPDKFCGSLTPAPTNKVHISSWHTLFLKKKKKKNLPDTRLAVFAAVSDFSRMLDPHKICINVMSLITWTLLGKALNQFATSVFYVIKKVKPGTITTERKFTLFWNQLKIDTFVRWTNTDQKTKTPP